MGERRRDDAQRGALPWVRKREECCAEYSPYRVIWEIMRRVTLRLSDHSPVIPR